MTEKQRYEFLLEAVHKTINLQVKKFDRMKSKHCDISQSNKEWIENKLEQCLDRLDELDNYFTNRTNGIFDKD